MKTKERASDSDPDPAIRRAFNANSSILRSNFGGLPFSEVAAGVFFAAASHAVARDHWLDDPDLLFALLSSDSATAAILEKAGADTGALATKSRDYQGLLGDAADLASAMFWQMPETGALSAQFAQRAGREHIDTATLAAGILHHALKHSGTREPILRILNDLSLNPTELLAKFDRYTKIDPYVEQAQFVLTLEQKAIQLSQSGFLDGFRIAAHEEMPSGLIVIKSSVLRDRGLLDRRLIDKFEQLINRSDVSEHDIQRFFEEHPEFLLGYDYKALHAQLTLFREDEPDLRPDFFLERVDSNFCDIVDLKKPNARLAKHPRNRSGFVSGVYDAIHQLREYRDYFEDSPRRKAFHERYGLNAYRPKVSVIIGRSSDYLDYVQRVQIEDAVASEFAVVTYDDIIAKARNRQMLLRDS